MTTLCSNAAPFQERELDRPIEAIEQGSSETFIQYTMGPMG